VLIIGRSKHGRGMNGNLGPRLPFLRQNVGGVHAGGAGGEFCGDICHDSDAIRQLLAGGLVFSKRFDHCCAALFELGSTLSESCVNLLKKLVAHLSDIVFSLLHLRCEGPISCLDHLELVVNCIAAGSQLLPPRFSLLPEGATVSGSATSAQSQSMGPSSCAEELVCFGTAGGQDVWAQFDFTSMSPRRLTKTDEAMRKCSPSLS